MGKGARLRAVPTTTPLVARRCVFVRGKVVILDRAFDPAGFAHPTEFFRYSAGCA
jgi:hypothetical protein